MPRRPPVALGALLLLTGCTGGATGPLPGVPVEPVNGLKASTLVTCRSFMGTLPDALTKGVDRVQTRPASDTTTAYGDPPITVRCGVPEGSERDEPYTFNAVMWALHDSGASRTWTSRGREVAVEVVVPDAYDGQAELVGTVSFAIDKAISSRTGGS